MLQMKTSAFARYRDLIQTLCAEDFRQASQDEAHKRPIKHPGVNVLRKSLRSVRAKITGTDEARVSMRSKVWSSTIVWGPPSLWVTLNPADIQDPIAQVIAGADIDLDSFCNTSGPDYAQQTKNISSDPFASAKFFHFMINILLETMFGIKKTKNGVQRQAGVFGIIQGYIGTVEAQGRGTLHVHMLLWLKDMPTPSLI
jgi:hypothetical protein